MSKHFIMLILLTPLLAAASPNWAMVNDTSETPWDTVMAEIQVIESLTEADSLKSGLMKTLFASYRISSEDYRLFYEQFLQQPAENQQKFITEVKAILQTFNQANREEAVKELRLDRRNSGDLPRK